MTATKAVRKVPISRRNPGVGKLADQPRGSRAGIKSGRSVFERGKTRIMGEIDAGGPSGRRGIHACRGYGKQHIRTGAEFDSSYRFARTAAVPPLFRFDDTLIDRSVNRDAARRRCVFTDITRPPPVPGRPSSPFSVISAEVDRFNAIFYKSRETIGKAAPEAPGEGD